MRCDNWIEQLSSYFAKNGTSPILKCALNYALISNTLWQAINQIESLAMIQVWFPCKNTIMHGMSQSILFMLNFVRFICLTERVCQLFFCDNNNNFTMLKPCALVLVLHMPVVAKKWGVLCQEQVSKAGTSNYIPKYLGDVISCPWPWYLLLAQPSWNVSVYFALESDTLLSFKHHEYKTC